MQAHYEEVQRIADATTLPHAMHYLSIRIAEELDLSPLTDKLLRGKEQPYTLSSSEKLELWDRLKILSFTKLVVALWAVTMVSLYIRVQVNILGRHLYIDTARGLGSSDLPEDADLIDRDDQQKFLASVDYLANYGMQAMISNVQAAADEALKGAEYTSVVDMSFKAAVDALIDEMRVQSGGSLISGMPLAKLVPRVVQMSPSLLAEPSNNRIIQVIRTIPEVELFFTLLYANMSDS
ncbi:peroxisome biogenesis protein 3-2 [Citrus sinensis]|nr:peroxisome biogenesis protein 3-2 [Citrus sinensis]KAH9802107.1 peroxisome biogenesis protein 3-2 [Citrus sinensis]